MLAKHAEFSCTNLNKWTDRLLSPWPLRLRCESICVTFFCCCNGSVGLHLHTACIWYVEVWELKLSFYPSAGGFKRCQLSTDLLTKHSSWSLWPNILTECGQQGPSFWESPLFVGELVERSEPPIHSLWESNDALGIIERFAFPKFLFFSFDGTLKTAFCRWAFQMANTLDSFGLATQNTTF